MPAVHVNPTRQELTKLKKKLFTARKGHKLLKDKRDEMMRQFLSIIRETKELREKVEQGITASHKGFVLARAAMHKESLHSSLMLPKQEVVLEVDSKNIMSVNTPRFTSKFRMPDESGNFPYGLAFTSSDLDNAVQTLVQLLPDMLLLSEKEQTCKLLADEIEKTRRRVNALEHVVIPNTEESIKYITMKLDENERSNQVRLLKVKSLVFEANRKAY